MKISKILVYQVDLPLHEGRYNWSRGNSISSFDSTIVQVETDEGVVGYGECCPLGPVYLPSYAAGVRAGISQVAPYLIDANPLELAKINLLMNGHLKGHPYVKSAIDVACWDILGKATGQPVYSLMGGRHNGDILLYRAISCESPDVMARKVASYRADGYTRFQLKVGNDPDADVQRIQAVAEKLQAGDRLVADANTGWLQHEAIRVIRGVRGLDVYIEQPCVTYEECLAVRRHCDNPFVLDEIISDVCALLRARNDAAMDVVNVKISRFGGLTNARIVRDICVELGIAMTLEDTWGGDIVTAAIAHLAQSTPEEFRFTSTDFNAYVTKSIAHGAPQRSNGRMNASSAPGLGVSPKLEVLGKPVLMIER